eukprot:TRINITY_DN4324_c0_g2_i1.p1 TRINITY_DN4324_c0_g2~~TRINITY_DN4324_c0_g2_i1.p1  ORF type:complete len:448 (+),score=51.12 TRINITY_DN4324_c0_g2_i1:22-1344(+)
MSKKAEEGEQTPSAVYSPKKRSKIFSEVWSTVIKNCKLVQQSNRVSQVRSASNLSNEQIQNLSVVELKNLLDQCGVDYRDCFEKSDLVQRVISTQASKEVSTQQVEQLSQQKSKLFGDEQYVVSLFQRCRNSVVNITTSREATTAFGMDPVQVPSGTGSGFLWDSDGHLVTNFHVIQNATFARVTLANNQSYDASLKGVAADKDIAVLKIDASSGPFQAIDVAPSHSLVVGQRVFAIGNPFGLDQTLTGGIVSGLGREMKSITGRIIKDVIQTDAAINPGNSGGPLLDSSGKLIGVNTMIYSPSGAFSGVGFAIPSDTVRRIVNQIIKFGKVTRPGMGITCVPDQTARQLGFKTGVIIQSVQPGSGAYQAGLRGISRDPVSGQMQLGDVIESVGGQQVKTVEDVVSVVEYFNVGDQVPLQIQRGNQNISVNVPLLQEYTS